VGFQTESETPRVRTTPIYVEHTHSSQEPVLNWYMGSFGVSSIRLDFKLGSFSYKIKSENKCLSLQHFFSTEPVTESNIISNDFVFNLVLPNDKNDLKNYFEIGSFPESHDLTSRYNEFYSQIGQHTTIYYNMFCPFWENEGQESNLQIEFFITNNIEEENILITNSQEKFNSYVNQNALIMVVGLEAIFNTGLGNPDNVSTDSVELASGDIHQVEINEILN
jgi:hypothetical protein